MPKLTLDPKGRLVCDSHPHLITYNTPFPTRNGRPGGFSEPADGVAIHTEVGYEHNVVVEFNNPGAQASAFCSVRMDGHIHQYGPIGKGWEAWTQVAGNSHYRGVENEDHGNPRNRLTPAQVESLASIIEVCSDKDGFPLQPTDNPNGGKGVIFHSDGGAAWGGHDCPGATRRKQRPDVIAAAKAIRAGSRRAVPLKRPRSTLEVLSLAVHVSTTTWTDKFDLRLASIRHSAHDRTEQHAVGVKVDGVWGPKSEAAAHITIKRIQRGLRVAESGKWDKTTEAAFVKLRAAHRGKQ